MISDFLESIGFSYQKTGKKNYALDTVVSFDDLDLSLNQNELDNVSCQLAGLIDFHQNKIKSDPALMQALCYPGSIGNLVNTLQGNYSDSPLTAMRLSYVVDVAGTPKLIETNSQTPSFWWECEDGADAVLSYFKKGMRNPKYSANLSNALQYGLTQ